MTTFIRNHPAVSGSGSSVATALSAAVPAGRLLVATIATGRTPGSGAPTALSKPGGETASWVEVVHETTVLRDASRGAYLGIWAIRTTVGWVNGQTITATLGSAEEATIGLAEFEGATVEVVTSDSNSRNDSSLSLNDTIAAATDETLRAGDLVVQGALTQFTALPAPALSGTATGTSQALASGGASRHFASTAYLINGSGGRGISLTAPSTSKIVVVVGLKSVSYPPDTPVLTTNADGRTLDRGRTVRLGWAFSSPNAVDAQSKFDLMYRLVGAGSWTTITQTTPNTFRDFAGGDLAAGDYEWQVVYYGALGQASPTSASGFFTAADSPDGPTITYPVDGQMFDRFETVTWSAPDQDAYQLRRVADDGGDPDPDTVYFDTDQVDEPATRSLVVEFETNNRTEHVQVRVLFDDLWSEWDDVLGDVSYTPPPTPTMTLYPNAGSLLVVIVNPDPDEGDPAAVSNNIWIDDGKGKGPQRHATGVSTNGTWLYETPVSGRDYGTPDALWVEAVAANGTTARSE